MAASALAEMESFSPRPVPLLERKQTHFVLWLPSGSTPPVLVIGAYGDGAPPRLDGERRIPMTVSPLSNEVFEVAAADCRLQDGEIYHYWFEVVDTSPYRASLGVVRCPDPTAYALDWRLTTRVGGDASPASVIRYSGGRLVPSDAEGPVVPFDGPEGRADVGMAHLPPNNRLVIYEVPAAWTQRGDLVDAQNVGVGTFRDVRALIEPEVHGGHFEALPRLHHHQHMLELGANALELLPPADSFADRKSWGYATSNYFAPDYDLGCAEPGRPTAVADLLALVRSCHAHGIRFFYDAVMAFSNRDPYRLASYLDYHVHFTNLKDGPFDHLDPEQRGRDGFGGDLWKFALKRETYDPVSGESGEYVRARRHLISHLLHWMRFYHVDGLRLDSVNNFDNWDFAEDVRREARAAWRERWEAEGNPVEGAEQRFLVVGEELSVPKGLLARLDGLWNEEFKHILRQVILGRSASGDASFEASVRKLIDCRNLGFSDTCQAVNYVGSHDVGGPGNERLYNYLDFNGVVFKAERIKLAFACLLSAVGIPMIFAGDEFADEHDIDIFSGDFEGRTPDDNKQLDPVNYERLERDPWRQDVFRYVSRLVKLRTTADALSVNDTDFIHVDTNDGKRVIAWRRGRPGVDAPVVVVANFSDFGTPNPDQPGAEYVVHGWPALPAGTQWHEIGADRPAPDAGREPLFPWEAKVYAAR